MSKQIAFIKVGINSYLNQAVEKLLRLNFPEYRLAVFDVTHDLFGSRLKAVMFNAFFSLKQHGVAAMRSFNTLFNNFYTTGYFHAVRRLVQQKINPADFAFSFQTQSLFDASIPGLPHFVYTDHAHLAHLTYPGFDPKNLAPSAWRTLECEIYHHAALVFTMSDNIARVLVRDYQLAPADVKCVYAGCNLASESPPVNGIRFEHRKILFVGKDWERKGGPVLLEAFAAASRRHPDAQLLIIGATPRGKLPPHCHVLGKVNRKKLIEAYQSAAIFCLPTQLEPFGLVILEAMAFGLPVVATHIGAIPEMIEDGANGYLVPPGDAKALADALLRLLADTALCQRFGAAGQRRINERYNWNTVGQLIRENIAAKIFNHACRS